MHFSKPQIWGAGTSRLILSRLFHSFSNFYRGGISGICPVLEHRLYGLEQLSVNGSNGVRTMLEHTPEGAAGNTWSLLEHVWHLTVYFRVVSVKLFTGSVLQVLDVWHTISQSAFLTVARHILAAHTEIGLRGFCSYGRSIA